MNQAPSDIRKRFKELNLLRDQAQGVIYDRETLTLRSMQPDTADVLAQILDGIDDLPDDAASWATLAQIMEKYEETPEVDIVESTCSVIPRTEADDIRARVSRDRYLNKLAINIANDCNLGCTYCYANKGLYGTPVPGP